MRSGRPSYHVKAKWISCFDPISNKLEFYELDNKGNLVKINGNIKPSKVTTFHLSPSEDPPDIKTPVENVSTDFYVFNEEAATSVEKFDLDTFFDYTNVEDEAFIGSLLEF